MGGKQGKSLFQMVLGAYVIYLGFKTISDATDAGADGLNKIIMASTALILAGAFVVIYAFRQYSKAKNEPDEELEDGEESESMEEIEEESEPETIPSNGRKSMRDIANLSAFANEEDMSESNESEDPSCE